MCLAKNPTPFQVGMIQIVLPCFMFRLKMPTVLCLCTSECLCYKQAIAIPFADGIVDSRICAFLCCQCMPNVGCCKPPIKVGGKVDGGPITPEMEVMER